MCKKSKLFVVALSSLLLLSGCSMPATTSKAESKESSVEASTVSSLGDTSTTNSSSEASSSIAQSSSKAEDSSNASSSNREAATYSVEVTKEEGVRLSGLEDKYEAGANVTFTLIAENGFAISDVKAVAGVNEVVLTKGENGVYSFIMPKRGVSITITTNRLSYKLTAGDPGDFIASIKQKKVGAADFVDLDTITEGSGDTEEGEETSEITYKTAEFGATIKVELQASGDYLLTSVSVNGEVIDLKGQMSFTFLMPAKDSSIRIEKEDMPIAITKVESDHFSLTLYKEDKVTTIDDNLVVPYSEVYVLARPKENNVDGRYSIKTVAYSYKNNGGTITTEDISKSIDDDADGFYHFRAPKFENLTVTITEYDTTAYADYGFLGDYLMLDLSNGGNMDKTSFTDGYSLRVQPSGLLSMTKGEKTEERLISEADAKEGEGNAKLSNGVSSSSGSFLYDGKAIVGDTYLEGSANTTSYLYVAVKKENANDTNSLYQVKATQFKVNEIVYGVICFYRDGAIYDNVLVKRENGRNSVSFGVEIEMLAGTYVSDAEALFIVNKNGTSLLKVGSQGDGGSGNRILLGEEYGDYLTEGGKTLHLDGMGGATYDGETFAYVLTANEITLTSNSKTINGTIDASTKTFVVTSEKEATALPEWAGYKFSGWSQWSSSDDDSMEKFILSFHANELKYDCKCLNGSYEQKDIDYKVVNGNTINGKIYSSSRTEGVSVTFTYVPKSSGVGYFQLKGGTTGMYFANAKFSVYTE